MNKLMLMVVMTASIAACNNDATKNTVSTDSVTTDTMLTRPGAAAPEAGGCYVFQSGRDTVSVQLEQQGENLTGPLSYNYFEKDRNDGTFQGTLSGDLITGFYLFRSEGIMSVRQEIWKLHDGRLLPAVGEMINRQDSMLFRDPSALKFDSTRALKKQPCRI